ncbi:hypothetical protein SAY87_019438 [Trapa incisa]|uniref:Uncharacterized protein n=1 Tax=Trapa incisa TaxID=236973 RepID=A0AAN7K546_9MYRT|nr:hypothetical protein SAY87_019438 [Trapa incisa]
MESVKPNRAEERESFYFLERESEGHCRGEEEEDKGGSAVTVDLPGLDPESIPHPVILEGAFSSKFLIFLSRHLRFFLERGKLLESISGLLLLHLGRKASSFGWTE